MSSRGNRSTLGTPAEAEAFRSLYARLPNLDFSKEILSARPGLLGLLRVRGVVWSDLGSPERVLSVRRHVNRRAELAFS